MTTFSEEERQIQDNGVTAKPQVRRFRPDIQGLRAIAILLVVLYHANVPGIRGGYVGVDVFFVISGYLITSQLVREVAKSGRLSLTRFYLKRVRRLLPSAVIVIVSTLCVAWVFAPPLLSKSLSVDGIFAALYTLNYRLAVEGINYQNAGAAPSAFQHFWSLGVEEQFYLFWPLLIVFAVILTRRWWRDLLPVFLLAVIVVSLYISQYSLVDRRSDVLLFCPIASVGVRCRGYCGARLGNVCPHAAEYSPLDIVYRSRRHHLQRPFLYRRNPIPWDPCAHTCSWNRASN